MREITGAERELLRRFAKLQISVDGLMSAFAGVFEFEFSEDARKFSSNLYLVEPGIEVTLDDIRHAVEYEAIGVISAHELCRWATMLRLNEAFVWNYENDFVVDALDVLSMPKLFKKPAWFQAS